MDNNEESLAILERLQTRTPNVVVNNERSLAQYSLHNIAGLTVGNVSYSANSGRLTNTTASTVIGRPVR